MHISSRSDRRKNIKVKIHSYSCLHKLSNDTCNCKYLDQVSTYRYLGITIDDNFRFSTHLHELGNKLRKVCFLMYHISPLVSRRIATTIYHAFFESLLRYGITIWGNACETHKSRIKRLQNQAIQTILVNELTNDLTASYQSLGLLPIDKLYEYTLICDNYFNSDYRIKATRLHNMTCRNRPQFKITRRCNSYGSNRLSVTVPMMLNKLPDDLIHLKNIAELKKKLKSYLLSR